MENKYSKNKSVGFQRLIFFFAFATCFHSGNAQTNRIPVTDGGFETGATFAANSWVTTANATAATNNWACSTGVPGYTGNRAAYITNNLSAVPPTYAYNIAGNVTAVHLYRPVTIPAGESNINLSFSWRGIGEGTTFRYDYLRVLIVPTSFTPVQGTSIATNANRILIGEYNNQATWINTGAITLPATYAGTTFRIVFEWVNDGSLGTATSPIAVDNILLTSQTPVVPANDNCAGAISLTPNAGTACTTTAGTTIGATQSQVACAAGSTADDDVWYSFTATSATHRILVTPSTLNGAIFQLFSGTCAALSSIACVDDTVGNVAEDRTFSGLTIGSVYFVRVYSFANGSGQGGFNICITSPPPPPANDNCSGAIVLTVNPTTTCTTSTAGTTVNATQSQAGCVGTADDDVWYSFVATSASHVVTITAGTMSDSVFQVFSGSCGTLSSVACSDPNTQTVTGLVPGNTYFIRIFSYGNATGQGTFSVCVTTIVPPVNDNCTGATALSVNATFACTISTNGTTVGASQSQAGCVGTADDDVWYSFIATSSTHVVTITSGTMTDSVFQVFSGSCSTLSSVVCSDPDTQTLTGLVPGNTYFVRVYSYYSGEFYQGTFSICVTTPVVPPNDNCPNAIVITAGAGCIPTAGTTSGATQSQAGCAGTADDDVWYQFTAAGATQTITVTPGTLYDAVFQVFSGGCGGLVSLGCSDGTVGANVETINISGLTIGSSYYIRVYSSSSSTFDQGTFTVCVTTPVPTSDNCNTASALPVNASPSCSTSASGTTVGATQSQVGCVGTADDDVWYNFTALGSSHTITVTPGTLTNAVFQVFSGTCGALTSIACINNTAGANAEVTTLTGLTAGAIYRIRIYSFGAAVGQAGTFTVCITTPCAPGPGTGVTSLGCPSVISGGLGLSGANPPAIDCLSSGCVNLEASYLQLGQTTSYGVSSIPFAPPYQFGCLTNPVSVNIDDVWSPVINLPFNFCFYGNTYNKCLMSSNGVITFDTTTNTAGGTSTWQILNNLPNTGLFKNSIFGVYHDIDPSKGGKVGWELITLNTGCRALVASWQGIPMFDSFGSTGCGTLLYTGMIVLYENTNIIDVYIQEKNVCAAWNSGNAIVGIQNSTATLSTVAPGRNGLDTDWTVNSEAWRFAPNGPSITSLKWFEGVGTTGPVVGTSDVLNVCPTATTTYTAEVTYSLCGGATLKEVANTTVTVAGNKVWNGNSGTNWNVDANWTPTLVPTSADCVVIPNVTNDPIISGTGFNARGYSLRVLPGGSLTLNSGNNLTVTNIVAVNPGADLKIKNNGSLIQVDNIPDIGIINMERITPPLYRFDYTYWNSPVTQSSNYTLGMLSQGLTQPDKYYSWIPSIGNNIGNWAQESVATVMSPTKGYIVRAPNSFSFTPTAFTPYTANFIGTPNNGNIACPITFGTLGAASLNDKWNLIGNPYPSAVSATAFLSDAANASVIDGTIYFWTHNSAINASFPDPFYGDYVLNYTASDYASWNFGTGGTAATTGGTAPTGFIAAGQSFFVQSRQVAGSATFKNTMRVANNNTQFFRPGEGTRQDGDGEETSERNRIWLNLSNNANAFNQLLVGYVENATTGWERGYDGITMNESTINFYSIIPEAKLVIQGRPLPFDVQDLVPLGINTSIAGDFSVRIDHVDGLFDNQNIYLEDHLLNVIHDLKASPYQFSLAAGTYDNRFVLRYTDNSLGVNDPTLDSGLVVFIKNKKIYARSSQNMKSIEVYDVGGKLVKTYLPGQNLTFEDDFLFSEGVYLAKVKLNDGVTTNKKLLN